MQETMRKEDKRIFVNKVLRALNGEPCIWGYLLPIVKENCLIHWDPLKWCGNGQPFSLSTQRNKVSKRKEVSTQTEDNEFMPIYPIFAFSAITLILVYLYANFHVL
jgi:hypothetical protein